MIRLVLAVWLLLLLLWPAVAAAHPLAPVGLSVQETGDGVELELKYSRVQPRGGAVFTPRYPPFCKPLESPTREDGRAVIKERYRLGCSAPLAGSGAAFGVAGLGQASVDGVVRIQLADGRVHHGLIDPNNDMFVVPAAQSALSVAGAYLWLGFEHLALGFDHVLLVLGLTLLLRRPKRVLLALTAFTVGHAVSLCTATLWSIALPRAPVEIGIAASLMWIAWEIMGHRSGELRRPYVAAVGVGLVHGLGFATALAEAGLTRQELPLALAGFHLGIELGQVLFVAAALACCHWADSWADSWAGSVNPVPTKWRAAPALAIGSIAAMWCIERAMAAVV